MTMWFSAFVIYSKNTGLRTFITFIMLKESRNQCATCNHHHSDNQPTNQPTSHNAPRMFVVTCMFDFSLNFNSDPFEQCTQPLTR